MAEAILNQPHFQDADKAREYLEALRWPNGPICPHCGVIGGHYRLQGKATRPGVYKCVDCSSQFTVTVGTVFERSKIPLHVWLHATHLMSASKKGVSAKQLERMLGVTYRTAFFMAHRIRYAMAPEDTGPLGGGGGVVEVDETFWGTQKGKEPKRGMGHKMKVVALVDRDTGTKRSFSVPMVTTETLRPLLKAQISVAAHLMTDEAKYYTKVGREFAQHSKVNHSKGEYVRGSVTTNTIESAFAVFKRGLFGTFHSVSEKHLQKYAREFDFRWNTRSSQGWTDTDRTNLALKAIGGKRLMYRRIVSP